MTDATCGVRTSLHAVPDTRLDVLLLCDRPANIAATVHQHIDALTGLSAHRVRAVPVFHDLPKGLDLNRFDVIVVHYTLVASDDRYLSPAARAAIAAFPGLKAIFVQDEYRFVDRTVDAIRKLGAKVLFTCVPENEIDKVYPERELPDVTKVNVLTGYVDRRLLGRDVPKLADRPIDVGYRARKLPAWLGELGQEKWRIGKRFAEDATLHHLICDISYREEDRLYGEGWLRLMARCKAILGVESGASVFDFTGEIQSAVEREERAYPSPSFEELRERHFKDKEGLVTLNQISPRCFEAAAMRTLMILYEGGYSGILRPWRHYVPLRKDHSNMEEVVRTLRDPIRSQEIVEIAFVEVACNPKYGFQAFVANFDSVLTQHGKNFSPRTVPCYTDSDLDRLMRRSFATRSRRLRRDAFHYIHLFFFRVLLGHARPETKDYYKLRLRGWLRAVKQRLG